MSYALDRDFDRMHTLDDFCALIGCRKTKAYDLIRDKKLRAVKAGSIVLKSTAS